MEIIIAMTLAFLLGAYVRQPITFVRKKNVELSKASIEAIKTEDRYIKQFDNLMSYSGKAQEDNLGRDH